MDKNGIRVIIRIRIRIWTGMARIRIRTTIA